MYWQEFNNAVLHGALVFKISIKTV